MLLTPLLSIQTLPTENLWEVTPEGNSVDVSCKCGEGWTCVVTKTSGPDAGKSIECGENCSPTIEGEKVCKEELKEAGDTACCKCGEGWSCVISRD
ncbi:uncharacterized protein LOC129284493 isoform X2 [Prosopis cineraria]|uniref:uncharacterized protein LOC129284493 isoform X2 n=1 Tax=Prosopis cineraria TaxID=364024 RepID=UPI00240EF49B|nr:uncharacterized protein LOC129284493 isoform X2 [Prosopis cineraria]